MKVPYVRVDEGSVTIVPELLSTSDNIRHDLRTKRQHRQKNGAMIGEVEEGWIDGRILCRCSNRHSSHLLCPPRHEQYAAVRQVLSSQVR